MFTPTQTYFIDPLAPLVFRDGRPFGETGDGVGLSFPWPTTTSGAVRAAIGELNALSFDDPAVLAQLKGTMVRGPLPCRIQPNGTVEPLFPKPADALYMEVKGQLGPVPLKPLVSDPMSGGMDLPDQGLLPIAPPRAVTPKGRAGPALWYLSTLESWLLGHAPAGAVDSLGIDPFPEARRTHVGIEPSTLASKEGILFQSSNLEFGHQRLTPDHRPPGQAWSDDRYGLLVQAATDLPRCLRRVGGEGRLAEIVPAQGAWPSPPPALMHSIKAAGRFRLILATPGLFGQGWIPSWLTSGIPPGVEGLRVRLKAAAVDRWMAVSGWDMEHRRARAVRRAVPAGATYWLEIIEGDPEKVLELWLASVCDREADRNDGFGLVLPGVW